MEFKTKLACAKYFIVLTLIVLLIKNKDFFVDVMAGTIGYSMLELQANALGDDYTPPAPKSKGDKVAQKISAKIYKSLQKEVNNMTEGTAESFENSLNQLNSVAFE